MIFFARYLLTAGTATCVDVALVQVLLTLDRSSQPVVFPLIIVAGACAGMSVNFLLSRRYVFAHDGRKRRQQFASFVAVSLSTLLLRLLVAALLVALLSPIPMIALLSLQAPAERLAHLGAVGLVTLYSFFAHKHLSFAGGILNRLTGRSTVVG